MALAELKKHRAGIVILNLLMLLGTGLFNYLDYRLILGMTIGNSYAVLSFCMLGATVEEVLTLAPDAAKSLMGREYAKRMFFTALVIIFGMTADFINPLGVILPLFFPKLAISFGNIFSRKGGENK